MIFVTVGTQLPFDRLVRAIDEWAEASRREDVFAQIGPGAWKPGHIRHTAFLDPEEFQARFSESQVVVGHAGMGSIISAMQSGKPILVMPRRESLREHRNDHQFATAVRLRDSSGLAVALDEEELKARLEEIERIRAPRATGGAASAELIARVRSFIETEPERTTSA